MALPCLPGDSAAIIRIQHFDTLPDSALLSVSEVMALTGFSMTSVYRRFYDGTLDRLKLGRSTRIRVGQLRQMLAGGAQ